MSENITPVTAGSKIRAIIAICLIISVAAMTFVMPVMAERGSVTCEDCFEHYFPLDWILCMLSPCGNYPGLPDIPGIGL